MFSLFITCSHKDGAKTETCVSLQLGREGFMLRSKASYLACGSRVLMAVFRNLEFLVWELETPHRFDVRFSYCQSSLPTHDLKGK